MQESNKKCTECFNRDEYLKLIEEIEPKELLKNRVEVRFKKGEVIFKQGTFASNICYLRKGLVKKYLEFNDKNLILRVEPAGQILGLSALCGNNIYRYTCVAYEDCDVCLIDINFFKKLIETNGKFADLTIRAISEHSIAAYDRMISLTQKKSHGRLADIILCLSERIYKDTKFELQFPRKDLAELSNMSVENLVRTLQELKRDKILKITGNYVEILNEEMLRTISANG